MSGIAGPVVITQGHTTTITTSETITPVLVGQDATLLVSGSGVQVTANNIFIGDRAHVDVTNGASLYLNNIVNLGTTPGSNLLGAGTLDISGGATLEEGTKFGLLQAVDFGPGGGKLILDLASQGLPFTGGFPALLGPILDFGAGDTIDAPVLADGYTYTPEPVGLPNVLVLTSHGTAVDTILLERNTGSFFNLVPHGTFTEITACYAAGTRLMTAEGEVAVEDLKIGQMMATFSGKGAATKPVTWIGWREIDLTTQPDPEAWRPVRIAAGAFGEGLPRRDLVVSPDHALFLDGVFVNARALLNGVTVAHDMAARTVRYFHVELENHDVLLAEGLPAESYLDTGNRSAFANNADVVALRPAAGGLTMQSDACFPLVENGPVLAGIRQKLINRLAELGCAVTHDPDLHLVVNGRVVAPTEAQGLSYRFDLPEDVRELRIVSRAGTPAGISAQNGDMRRLGVCLGELRLHTDAGARIVPLDHPALAEGFHAPEQNGSVAWRWTDGAAKVPAGLVANARRLDLQLVWVGAYWTDAVRADRLRLIA